MRRYEVNDLLEEGDLLTLTEEAMARPARPARRGWRRAAAVAACLALVVCLANFGAIAAGVERLFRYVAGVGAVPEESLILVQEEPIEWTYDGRTYVVRANQRNGYIMVELDVLSKQPEVDRFGDPRVQYYKVEILAGDTPLTYGFYDMRNGWERHEDQSGGGGACFYPLQGGGMLDESRYFEAGYATMAYRDDAFEAAQQPEEGYTLRVEEIIDSDMVMEIPLRLVEPSAISAVTDTLELDEGTVTALVSSDGTRVTFAFDSAPLAEDTYLNQVLVSEVTFKDEFGNSYQGGYRNLRSGAGAAFMSEVALTQEPVGKITSVEIHNVNIIYAEWQEEPKISMEDGVRVTDHWEHPEVIYDNLGWVIDLP